MSQGHFDVVEIIVLQVTRKRPNVKTLNGSLKKINQNDSGRGEEQFFSSLKMEECHQHPGCHALVVD